MTMLGLKHSAATRAKMSAASKGRPKSGEHCRKMAEIFKGNGSKRWKGGNHIKEGYFMVWIGPRKYQKRCRIIVEQMIGRPLLPNECVHHVNKKRMDDRPENLMVLTNSEHLALHQRMRKAAEIHMEVKA